MRSASASTFGLPREARFRRRDEFRHSWTVGRKYHTPHFLIYWYFLPEQTCLGRLGVTVSRKVGSAVERNRIKRLVRENYRQRRLLLGPMLISVIAKRGAAAADNRSLIQELLQLFDDLASQRSVP